MRLYRIEAEAPPSDIPGINADLRLNRELIAPLLLDATIIAGAAGQLMLPTPFLVCVSPLTLDTTPPRPSPPPLPFSTLCCLLLAVQPYRPFTLTPAGHPYDEEAWTVLREVGAAYEGEDNAHRVRGTIGCPYLLVEHEEGGLPFRTMSEMLALLRQHEKRPRDGSGLARIDKYGRDTNLWQLLLLRPFSDFCQYPVLLRYYNAEKNRWEVGSPLIPEALIADWRYSLMFTWPEYKRAIELLISAKSQS
jgi:hypothetical protein